MILLYLSFLILKGMLRYDDYSFHWPMYTICDLFLKLAVAWLLWSLQKSLGIMWRLKCLYLLWLVVSID